MQQTCGMYGSETVKDLFQIPQYRLLCIRHPPLFQSSLQVITLHKVHCVVSGAVLLETFMHLHHMDIVNQFEPFVFLLEFHKLGAKSTGIFLCPVNTHSHTVCLTLVSRCHKELLDGNLRVTRAIFCKIRLPEATRREVALYSVFPFQDSTDRK